MKNKKLIIGFAVVAIVAVVSYFVFFHKKPLTPDEKFKSDLDKFIKDKADTMDRNSLLNEPSIYQNIGLMYNHWDVILKKPGDFRAYAIEEYAKQKAENSSNAKLYNSKSTWKKSDIVPIKL